VVALATSIINKTHKIVSVEGLRTGFIELSTCMLQSVVGKSFRFAMASGFAIWQPLSRNPIPHDYQLFCFTAWGSRCCAWKQFADLTNVC
jgi:hypothetical protein